MSCLSFSSAESWSVESFSVLLVNILEDDVLAIFVLILWLILFSESMKDIGLDFCCAAIEDNRNDAPGGEIVEGFDHDDEIDLDGTKAADTLQCFDDNFPDETRAIQNMLRNVRFVIGIT